MSCVKLHTATSFPLCSSSLTDRYSTRDKPVGSRELRITGILGSWYAADSARARGGSSTHTEQPFEPKRREGGDPNPRHIYMGR
jgi:hypothetical protein